MKLSSSNTSFGRHESFALRFGWLTKGVSALREDVKTFEREDATVAFGVGKNMVSAIRFWLQAAQIVERQADRTFVLSPIGEVVFESGGDPYLEDEGTIWLLHWLLSTNPVGATAIYWFFNHFHKPEFTGPEVASGLRDFVKQNIEQSVAAATIKNDAALLQRMYVRSTGNNRVAIEEALDSPLALLNLQERVDSKSFRATPMDRDELPLSIFTYAVGDLMAHADRNQVTIEYLMYSDIDHCAPGAVFRMTEDGLLKKVEQMCIAYPETFRIDQTAGLHQLYQLMHFDPVEVLKSYYLESLGEEAA